MAISSQVLPRKRLEHLIVKTLIVKLTRIKNGQDQKPWFDQDCKFARQKYRKSKRSYKLNNTKKSFYYDR